MVMKNTPSLVNVGIHNKFTNNHHQYGSTPHLFVFQTAAASDDEVDLVDNVMTSNMIPGKNRLDTIRNNITHVDTNIDRKNNVTHVNVNYESDNENTRSLNHREGIKTNLTQDNANTKYSNSTIDSAKDNSNLVNTKVDYVHNTMDDDDTNVDNVDNASCSSSTITKSSGNSSKEPIYSTTLHLDPKKRQVLATDTINEKYMIPYNTQNFIPEDPLVITEDDISRIEIFFRGRLTQVWVSRTMANLYHETGTSSEKPVWQLKFTGVPLVLLDSGNTKSRDKRMLQLIIAEKGTGFALWKDVIDNLTAYKVQEAHFHTFYLSSDHRQKFGLSFNDAEKALNFHSILDRLTSDPANISLSGPGKKKKEKSKEKPLKYKPLKKTDISRPCNFSHITAVDSSDKSRFFSLQIFSRKQRSLPISNPNNAIET